MSALINLSINLDNLPKEKFIKGKKRRVSFTSKPKTAVSGGEVDENGLVIVNETTLESDK